MTEQARFTGFVLYPYDKAMLALDNDGLTEACRQAGEHHYEVEEIDVDVEGATWGQRNARAWDKCERIFRETLNPDGRLVAVEERTGWYI